MSSGEAVEPNPGKTRPLGFARGEVWIADDFDELPEDLLKEFYGGELPELESEKKKKGRKRR